MAQERIKWLDCAKFTAITAVVIDHCNGFLYTKPWIANMSYYSVSLFVLLSGISTWVAYERRKNISFAGQFRMVLNMLKAYAVATIIILCIMQRRFDLKTYLLYLVSFNIQAPYYYLVFFVQLTMIAPVFVNWCESVNNRKHKWMIQAGTLAFLGWFAWISIQYTYILPVHGGGQFLGGGTYIVLYYLGIMMAGNGVFGQSRKMRLWIAFICTGMAVLWVKLMTEGKLPFDEWMSPYWGMGFNPPSINFMSYSLFILFICYSVFSILSELKQEWLQKMISILCFLGKNTLFIWLYHLLVKSFFAERFPDLLNRNGLIRLVVFCIIVILPAIAKQIISLAGTFCYRNIYQTARLHSKL